MAKLNVLDNTGKQKESIDLPEEVFSGRVNQDVIHQVIVKYQAGQRQGNASTKERGEVSGGGRKPYKQKGTGCARAGSSRSPLWVGGGVTFGPKKRDFSYEVPKKIKKIALRESLNARYLENELYCIDDIKEPITKTKDFAKILKSLKLDGKVLGMLDGSDDSISKSSRNLPYFELVRSQDVNALDILKNKRILVTKTAFKNLIERITAKAEKVEKPKTPKKESK